MSLEICFVDLKGSKLAAFQGFQGFQGLERFNSLELCGQSSGCRHVQGPESRRAQLKKLESTIREAEQERQAQLKELEGVVGERDILGAQLIRRNEEPRLKV